jgi:hypothetical protein
MICDKCGERILPRDSSQTGKEIPQKVVFYGVGISYVDYVAGSWEYDCCNRCMLEVSKLFKDS